MSVVIFIQFKFIDWLGKKKFFWLHSGFTGEGAYLIDEVTVYKAIPPARNKLLNCYCVAG